MYWGWKICIVCRSNKIQLLKGVIGHRCAGHFCFYLSLKRLAPPIWRLYIFIGLNWSRRLHVINGKRRRAAPPYFTHLIPHQFCNRSAKFWGQVMSGHGAIQGHVTQPQNPKSQVWRGAKGTTANRSNWNFHNIIRSWGKINRHNKNFPIVDLRWGQFSGHPIISLWGKNQKSVFGKFGINPVQNTSTM